ncbi:MAG TPA: dual specificity protein phosphatase family protein, partial [Actinomycetota bacterium]|nr:dual specificity protein phosphatase family protein [Actinomycetota bacterium]HXF72452.1 dual specificity protein phosphatase family protein [Actinomycetota bacterium]
SVLVHCGAGINRASLVSGRALEWSGLRAQEAIDLLRARRPGTLSNPSFEAWLREQGRA